MTSSWIQPQSTLRSQLRRLTKYKKRAESAADTFDCARVDPLSMLESARTFRNDFDEAALAL
eukprot:1333107-Pleurochrysis_carterae.AAC.1